MKIEHGRIATVRCPECGERAEVDIAKGTEIGSVTDQECPQGHSFRVRVEENELIIVPPDLDL